MTNRFTKLGGIPKKIYQKNFKNTETLKAGAQTSRGAPNRSSENLILGCESSLGLKKSSHCSKMMLQESQSSFDYVAQDQINQIIQGADDSQKANKIAQAQIIQDKDKYYSRNLRRSPIQETSKIHNDEKIDIFQDLMLQMQISERIISPVKQSTIEKAFQPNNPENYSELT